MIYKEYSLVGGQPVKISPLEVTDNGTSVAKEGCAYNPVVVNVAGADIEELTVTENGTYTATSGKAYSPVNVNVSAEPYVQTLSKPYGNETGLYFFTGIAEDESTVAAYCQIDFIDTENYIEEFDGDGTATIDTTGDAPTLVWTPSVTVVEENCLYASRAEL